MAKKKIGTIILAGVLASLMLLTGCGGTGKSSGSADATSSTSTSNSSETDTKENNSDSSANGAESVENSGDESQGNSETAAEPEQIEFDYYDMFGGVEACGRTEFKDYPYSEIDNGYLVVLKDGRVLTVDEADELLHGKDLMVQYYEDNSEGAFENFLESWEYKSDEERAFPGFDQIDGMVYCKFYRVRYGVEKYSEMLFARAEIRCVMDCPKTVKYEDKEIPVVSVHYDSVNFGERNVVIPELAQDTTVFNSTFNDLEIKSNKTQKISVFDCRCGRELHFTDDSGEQYIEVVQTDGVEKISIPDNGSVKSLRLSRTNKLTSLNSDEAGVISIPEGTESIDIMEVQGLKKIFLPDTLTEYKLSSNNNLKVMSFKGVDYTDMAELQVAVGNNSVGDDMSAEMEGLVEDIRNLDADEANKNGQEFSFIGKDYWQNNIFYTVWYENGYWRVKLDISEGGRDVHTTGYFDSDFVYHNS